MKTSVAARRLIEEFEGFRATPYRCPAGVPSIGFGHAIKKGEKFTRLTLREGEALLVKDLEPVESAIDWLVTAPLAQNQYDALASLVYNIGSKQFGESTLLTLLNAEDYAQAAGQFARWVKSGEKTLPGLVKRRAAEAKLFVTK